MQTKQLIEDYNAEYIKSSKNSVTNNLVKTLSKDMNRHLSKDKLKCPVDMKIPQVHQLSDHCK